MKTRKSLLVVSLSSSSLVVYCLQCNLNVLYLHDSTQCYKRRTTLVQPQFVVRSLRILNSLLTQRTTTLDCTTCVRGTISQSLQLIPVITVFRLYRILITVRTQLQVILHNNYTTHAQISNRWRYLQIHKQLTLISLFYNFTTGVCKTRTGYLRIEDTDGKMQMINKMKL